MQRSFFYLVVNTIMVHLLAFLMIFSYITQSGMNGRKSQALTAPYQGVGMHGVEVAMLEASICSGVWFALLGIVIAIIALTSCYRRVFVTETRNLLSLQ